MLRTNTVFTMVAVKDVAAASEFYENVLELERLDDNPAGVMYKSGTGQLFVYATEFAGTAKNTVATWEVDDIRAEVDWLKGKGVKFEHYDFPGTEHDGDVHVMGEEKAAWFKDPDGNILGLTEMPA